MKISNRGFSIVEAMIVIIILGALILVGLPMLNSSLDSSKLKSGGQIFMSAVMYAKLSAAKNNCYFYLVFQKDSKNRFTKMVLYRDTDSDLSGMNDSDDWDVMKPDGSVAHINPVEKTYYLPEGTEFVFSGRGLHLYPYRFFSGLKALVFKQDGTFLPPNLYRESEIGIKISGSTNLNNDTCARYKITNMGLIEYNPF